MPDTDTDYITRWNGVVAPNEAARVALAELSALVAELEKLRGGLTFEMEPSGFEQALQDCREPGR